MKVLLVVMAALLAAAPAAELALIQPKDLAAQLQAKGSAPAIFHVGPNVLFRGKHIPASVYAGPGFRNYGLDMLKAAVEKVPRDRDVVVYCGCCPWDRCPNVKPAMDLLR